MENSATRYASPRAERADLRSSAPQVFFLVRAVHTDDAPDMLGAPRDRLTTEAASRLAYDQQTVAPPQLLTP